MTALETRLAKLETATDATSSGYRRIFTVFGGADTDDVNGFLLTHGYAVDGEDLVIRVVGLEPVDTTRADNQPADAFPLSLGKVVDCVGYVR